MIGHKKDPLHVHHGTCDRRSSAKIIDYVRKKRKVYQMRATSVPFAVHIVTWMETAQARTQLTPEGYGGCGIPGSAWMGEAWLEIVHICFAVAFSLRDLFPCLSRCVRSFVARTTSCSGHGPAISNALSVPMRAHTTKNTPKLIINMGL